jgi:hypothetical protein
MVNEITSRLLIIGVLGAFQVYDLGLNLATDLRQANVTGLQGSQLDLTRRCPWTHLDQAKSCRIIFAPLSKFALVFLHKQLGRHETKAFNCNGKPIT